MKTVLAYIMFFTIVLLIYFAINSYVFHRLAAMLAIKRSAAFYLFLVVMTLSFVVAIACQTHWPNYLTRIFYLLAMVWVGVILWLFCLTVLCDLFRLVLRLPIPPRPAAVCILILVGLTTLYALFNARRIVVRTVSIPAPVRLRLVQLSDVHLGSLAPSDFAEIIRKTNALKPDVVCITGDLVDNLNSVTRSALKQIDDFNAPVYLITGNHERYVGAERLAEALVGVNVKYLRNAVVDRPGLQIIGIDDSGSSEYLDSQLAFLPLKSDAFKILLFHRPEHPEIAVRHGVNLMLSGHTHRGQFIPLNFLVRSRFQYFYGLFTFDSMKLYVTCGTGYWGPPLRLGSTREIVLFDLAPACVN